jgi:hypothetical protein
MFTTNDTDPTQDARCIASPDAAATPRPAGASAAAAGAVSRIRSELMNAPPAAAASHGRQPGSVTPGFRPNMAATVQKRPDHDLQRLLTAVDAGAIAPRVAARLYGFLTLERERPGMTGFPDTTARRHRRQLRDLGFAIEDPRTTRAAERAFRLH